MATPQEVAEVRSNTNQPANEDPYTDEFISGLVDSYGVDGASGKIWRAKANAVSTLVDMSEGGSSRKLSQVFTNYEKIAAGYEADQATSDGGGDFYQPRTRKATRV